MSQDAATHIDELKLRALGALAEADGAPALEEWRVAYLGRRGELTLVLRGLSQRPPGERRAAGAAANRAKNVLEQALDQRRQALREADVDRRLALDAIDVTLPGWPTRSGGLHPTTRTTRELCQVFGSMGFQVVEGPEVELDQYNFEKLNIPKHHPARDMWNTLWVDFVDENGDRPMLLRTHTSPMQARVMERQEPPCASSCQESATGTRPPTPPTSGS